MKLGQLLLGLRASRKMKKGDQQGAMELAARAGLMNAEVDPSDPAFAPVKGVDVDRYAHVCRKLAAANQQGHTDEASLNKLLSSEGINPADWTEIATAWNDRVMNNMAVKLRYSQTFLGG